MLKAGLLLPAMAEIEFSVLARACLKGRNPEGDALHKNVSAGRMKRNATLPEQRSTGASPPRTPEPNSAVSILTLQL